MKITWRVVSGEVEGENGREKAQGIRSIIGRHENRQGVVKNSKGNREARELLCMMHGHELRGCGMLDGGGLQGRGRGKGRKKLGQL